MKKDIQDMTIREIRAAYYRTVDAIAGDIRDNAKKASEAGEHFDEIEQVSESVHGSEWVIYTFRARLVKCVSDNVWANAVFDPSEQKGGPELIASYVMRADVWQTLERMNAEVGA